MVTIKNYSTSMFIGETTGSIPQPVWYDSHTPIFNNKPPGALVTGSPGSGKTFFSLTIAATSAVLGKKTIVLDPKGDFLALKEIQDDIGKVTIWNLGPAGAKSKAGILDPFYMAKDPGEILSLVIDVIELFTGGLSENQMTVLAPIIKDVIQLPVPSLQKVVEICRSSTNEDARNLGTKLDLISRMPSAKLCFAPGNAARTPISIDKGTTVITLVGMDLPASPEEAREGNANRLASGVLYLITDYIRRVMHNDDSGIPKSLIIDEAWSVISSEQGAKIVKSVALLGRSKQLSLTLVTQSNSHLKELDIENTITTRFAFRTSQKEAEAIIKGMDLPSDAGFEGILTQLDTGECLMQDWLNRYSTVQITKWNDSWAEAFESNPLEKLRKKKARSQQAKAAQ